jgi:hypothetical protein
MLCDITDALSFSFPFPLSPSSIELLQTCSTSELVYDHACFCVYVYLWIYLPHMRENMQLLCFWSWLTSLNMMPSNCIHLPSNHMSSFLHLLSPKIHSSFLPGHMVNQLKTTFPRFPCGYMWTCKKVSTSETWAEIMCAISSRFL